MEKTKSSKVDDNNMSHGIVRKHITFFERLSHDYSSSCRCRLCSKQVITEPVTVKVLDDKTKRLVTFTEHKLIDNKAFLSQFNVTDFALQTLIDSGALASMRSVSFSGDNLTSISNINRLMNSLDSIESSNNTNS